MNRSLVLKRLCWKEFRQLWPLIVMLAVIGLLFQVLVLISDPSSTNLLRNLLFLGLPGLFAAGVGALLVGQERDSRTLHWMASLPILRQDIIRVKYFAAIVSLASVWIISFALYVVSNSVSRIGQNVFPYEVDISYGILYSIFLLTVSFATAWAIIGSPSDPFDVVGWRENDQLAPAPVRTVSVRDLPAWVVSPRPLTTTGVAYVSIDTGRQRTLAGIFGNGTAVAARPKEAKKAE